MSHSKKIWYIGASTFLVLALLALILYKQRIILLDIAFHLFEILRTGDFAFQNHRVGAFLTQSVPLVASKLGLSITPIMMLYSLSFVAYYFMIFWLCTCRLHAVEYGLATLLLGTLMVTDTFYWMLSEFPQGMAVLMLYLALIKYSTCHSRYKTLAQVMVILLAIFLIFYHPLMIAPFVFCSLYLLLARPAQRRMLVVGLGIFLVAYVLKSEFLSTQYEDSAIENTKLNFKAHFPDLITLQSNKNFAKSLVTDFIFLLALYIYMIWVLIRERRFYRLALLITAAAAYLALINITYADGAQLFYIENMYLPLGVFVSVAFVLERSITRDKIYYGILIGVLAVRLIQIAAAHRPYTERLAYLTDYMHQSRDSSDKVIIDEKYFDMDKLMMSWGSPYEFWLLSMQEYDQMSCITITDRLDDFLWAAGNTDDFIPTWGVFPFDSLPQRYFKQPDSSAYEVIP